MASIHLEWAPNPASEQVTSYQVYESFNAGAFVLRGTTALPEFDIANAPTGLYQWKVRAVNLAGISVDSEITDGPSIPSQPAAPVVTVLVA